MTNTDWRDHLVRLDAEFDAELIPQRRVLEFLGINEMSVKRDKNFPRIRIGGRYYVPKVELAKYMARAS